jgi:hypothetical protein
MVLNIFKIIEKRWVTQMDHPLYVAALYLNLGRLHSLIQANDDAIVGQLRGCFLDVLERLVEDEEIRNKIDAQSLDYEGLRGDAFSNKLAKQNLQNSNLRTCCFLVIAAGFSMCNLIPASIFLSKC